MCKLKKMSKKEVKTKSKTWITQGIKNSIKRRENFIRNLLNQKINKQKIITIRNTKHSEIKLLKFADKVKIIITNNTSQIMLIIPKKLVKL